MIQVFILRSIQIRMANGHQIDIQAFQEEVQNMIGTIQYFENLPPEEPLAFDSGFETSKNKAENYINQPTIKQRICEAITSINNDLFEINRTITPVLVGAILAETIVMPLNPIIFAWIVLLVSRAGIKQYCNAD